MYDFLVVIQGSYQEIRYDLYDIIYDHCITTEKWRPGSIKDYLNVVLSFGSKVTVFFVSCFNLFPGLF